MEKAKIVDEKLKLQEEYLKFQNSKSEEIDRLSQAIDEVQNENMSLGIGNIEEEMKIPTDIIELDIGGTHKIATSRATLTKFPSSALG